jgi:hypothetical protein
MYAVPVVRDAQERRLATIEADLEAWKVNMRDLLSRKYARKVGDDRVFRWHDSGDLRSVEHLEAIVWIAEELPTIRFWLPTKEYGIVRSWKRPLPDNLVVRVSAPMVGKRTKLPDGMQGSTVGAGTGFRCGAYTRGGKCGPCRACWKKTEEWVDYPQH